MKTISETEHVRLAQWFINEPFQRMGVLGFPASGQRTWPFCPPGFKGTDSRLCGALSPACGGKHVHELTLTLTPPKETPGHSNRRRRELDGSRLTSPRFNCQIQPS
jgi:hypothetical protein